MSITRFFALSRAGRISLVVPITAVWQSNIDVSQDEINHTLTEFFSGHPSISPEYNHTVSAGSAKPTSVQTRRDVMQSLLPVADEVEEPDPEDDDGDGFDNMDEPEQFKEEEYAV